MALFQSLSLDPMPYIFRRQREKDYVGVQSVFMIRPMTNRETQLYFNRREAAATDRRNTVESQADAISNIDHETLRGVLSKATHIYKDGDELSSPDEVALLIERFSWGEMQELLTAATNRSTLEAGEKNF